MAFLGHDVPTFAQPDRYVNQAFHRAQIFVTFPPDRMAADGKALKHRVKTFAVVMLWETGLGAFVLRFLARQ
jgi:hypothetical protein